jgi:formylglycine-generating enzyme required for sulfatase activity
MSDGEHCCWSGQLWSSSGGECIWADQGAKAAWERAAAERRRAEAERAEQAEQAAAARQRAEAARQRAEAERAEAERQRAWEQALGIEWVNLGQFSISKTEVTVGQYRKCVEAGSCTAPSTGGSCNWGKSGREDHPVNCVDWHQATAFAMWAGGRLPSGEEWTYAATSGGKPWKYPWGNERPTCSRAHKLGCGRGTTPVCGKPAGNSTHGVCDLAGNVWEWTDERAGAADRVLRGGGWRDIAAVRASRRLRYGPSNRFYYLGFRLAR